MSDLTKKAAQMSGKPADEYRVDEFENIDGGYSAALVDNKTGSITLQANSHDAGSARKRLEEAVNRGEMNFLDPGVPPKVVQHDWKNMESGEEREAAARETVANREEAQRVTDGYNVLNTGGEVEIPSATVPPTPSDEDEPKGKSKGTKPKEEYSADSNEGGQR